MLALLTTFAYYIVTSFGLSGFLGFLLWLLLIGVFVAVVIWLVRYLGFPAIIEKLIIAIAVIFLLIVLIDFVAGGGPGPVIVR